MSIIHIRRNLHRKFVIIVSAVTFTLSFGNVFAESVHDLENTSRQSLQMLYQRSALAEGLSHKATAILVFPSIIKAGLVFGGAYGEGVLLKDGHPDGYYNSVTGSWGWQFGATSYRYVVFLMNKKALQYLIKSKGWEFGTGPSLVLINEGVAKNFSSTTMRSDSYAFIFDQKGLMANLSIEGTKITKIQR